MVLSGEKILKFSKFFSSSDWLILQKDRQSLGWRNFQSLSKVNFLYLVKLHAADTYYWPTEWDSPTQGKGLTEILPFLGIKVIGIQAEAHFLYAILMWSSGSSEIIIFK